MVEVEADVCPDSLAGADACTDPVDDIVSLKVIVWLNNINPLESNKEVKEVNS